MDSIEHLQKRSKQNKEERKVFKMKVEKSLFLNGLAVVTVKKSVGETLFMISHESGDYMCCVPYSQFMEQFKSLAYVFITSYDIKLIEEYREFDNFIRTLSLERKE